MHQNHHKSFKVPTGKIHEVLKSATKQDIKTIREEWAGMMQTMQKSHAALLEETEPVAASENAFVLKFKYEIHCLMASENPSLRSGLSDALRSRTGKAYEVVYVPEEGWLKVRGDFIRKNGLAKQQEPESSDEETPDEEMLSFVKDIRVHGIRSAHRRCRHGRLRGAVVVLDAGDGCRRGIRREAARHHQRSLAVLSGIRERILAAKRCVRENHDHCGGGRISAAHRCDCSRAARRRRERRCEIAVGIDETVD